MAPEPFQRLRGQFRRVIQPPLGDPGVGQRMGDLRPQQALAQPVGSLRCLIQCPLGVAGPAQATVRLADPVQRLRCAPRVLSLTADLQRPLLPLQRDLPVTGRLVHQRVVLQQGCQQRLVPFLLGHPLQGGQRLADQGRRRVHVAGEVLDLGEQVRPPADAGGVPRGLCQAQPVAGVRAGVTETPAVQLDLGEPEHEPLPGSAARLAQRGAGQVLCPGEVAAAERDLRPQRRGVR